MDASQDWRSGLTASERYDNIQKLRIQLEHDAMIIENNAYKSSLSRDEYDTACRLAASNFLAPSPSHKGTSEAGDKADDGESGYEADADTDTAVVSKHDKHGHDGSTTGVTIGAYEDCHHVDSGFTAEVYRCGDRALKVIVETRDIEPHSPLRESKILAELKRPCIPLLETFRDREQHLVLVFPYMPFSLASLLEHDACFPTSELRSIFSNLFEALAFVHAQGIVHRDIKPSSILLHSKEGPAYLSDFGSAWHPSLSTATEPANAKVLDIGTGPYRAPEVLFGNREYDCAVDIWSAGTVVAECCRPPPSLALSAPLRPETDDSNYDEDEDDNDEDDDNYDNNSNKNHNKRTKTDNHGSTGTGARSLFTCPPAHEDGSQLGLILSIFKTLGSPTREIWPEAADFRTPPFDMYRTFPGRSWLELLPDADPRWRDLVSSLVRYSAEGRPSALGALNHPCFLVNSTMS